MPEKTSDKKNFLFSQFFKLSSAPTILINASTFKIIDANAAALELLKYSLSEIKKKYVFGLSPEKEQKKWKNFFTLHKSKSQYSTHFPLKPNGKNSSLCPIEFVNPNPETKTSTIVATIDAKESQNIQLINTLKSQNKDLGEQSKRLLDVNRRMVVSYENIKKQYEEILTFMDDKIKAERKKTIGEMAEVFQDKVNKPLNRILDDIQKIQTLDKELDSAIVKRLKLIEESVENIMRIIARIAEVQDIKKMKYIELSNI